jgi:hypothetical protein
VSGSFAPDERERDLEAAAREYGRLLTLGDRDSREPIERKYDHLEPELGARLDEVEQLLGTPTRPHTAFSAAAAMQRQQMMGREWRSKTELFGWPLVHVAHGIDPETGKPRVAKGIIAVGNIAIGGVAVGGMAIGGFTVGGLSLGVLGIGGCAAGGIVLGGLAIGVMAFGGFAVGLIAMGGFAIGQYAAGGGAAGQYVYTGRVQDPEAKAVFQGILDGVRSLLGR